MRTIYHLPRVAIALSVSLGLAQAASVASAAQLSLMSAGNPVDVISATGTVDGDTLTHEFIDGLSNDSGPDTALFTEFQPGTAEPLGDTMVEAGHDQLLSLDTSGPEASLPLDMGHLWAISGNGTLANYSLVQSLSVDNLSLRVQGNAGEALGQLVKVHFSGWASVLTIGDTGSASGTHDFELSLDVLNGLNPVASYQGLWGQSADDLVDFSFDAAVGDELTLVLSAYQGLDTEPDLQLAGLTEFGGQVSLNGSFSVSPVPEPMSLALAIAGMAALWMMGQRRL
jgi:hypothetical protein